MDVRALQNSQLLSAMHQKGVQFNPLWIGGMFLIYPPDPVTEALALEFQRRSAEPGNPLRRLVMVSKN